MTGMMMGLTIMAITGLMMINAENIRVCPLEEQAPQQMNLHGANKLAWCPGSIPAGKFQIYFAFFKTYDKMVTLSVGQLTVGVTVPEWSGVLGE